MSNTVLSIRASDKGDVLYLKDIRQDKGITYIKYKSTFNDMPFVESEIVSVDGGVNAAILGSDGTILFRFDINWLNKL